MKDPMLSRSFLFSELFLPVGRANQGWNWLEIKGASYPYFELEGVPESIERHNWRALSNRRHARRNNSYEEVI